MSVAEIKVVVAYAGDVEFEGVEDGDLGGGGLAWQYERLSWSLPCGSL